MNAIDPRVELLARFYEITSDNREYPLPAFWQYQAEHRIREVEMSGLRVVIDNPNFTTGDTK